MLAQMIYRRDAERVREEEKRRRGEGERRRPESTGFRLVSPSLHLPISLPLRLCVSAVIFFCISCSSAPTDVRTVMPADAIVYLETNDLGRAITAITENPNFQNAAKTKPDFSSLNGIKMAVAVTGFEGSREELNEEQYVGNVTPRFVAVAETNAWSWQTTRFAENKLGEFINEIYGGEIEMERYPKHDGTYYVWTAQDGRKAYGLVIGSLIFFGNDESSIERCVAVRKGEAEAIAKSSKLPNGDFLASGYVSPDGVGQIANLASIQLALGAGEEDEVRRFIADVLPEILRNSLTDVTWTSKKSEQGIEDNYVFAMKPEVGQVFSETIVPMGGGSNAPATFVPPEVLSVTRYDFKDAQVAWRGVLLTAQKQTDETSGGLIGAFSSSLFEPYGVEEPEAFLSAVGSPILTLRFDPEGENLVVISTAKDIEKLKKSLDKDINTAKPPERIGDADIWRSADGNTAFASIANVFLLGDAESVTKCLQARNAQSNVRERLESAQTAASVTITTDPDPAARLVEVLAERKDDKQPLISQWTISTEFKKDGIHRREVSDFGFIGSVIEQFARD